MRKAARWAASRSAPPTNISSPARTWTIIALASLSRAQDAIKSGYFATEIAPVTIKGRKGDTIVDTDEAPGRGMPDKIPTLKPAFAKEGTITAATSSSISDGAAAIVLTRQSTADAKGYTPVARIVATAAHAQ